MWCSFNRAHSLNYRWHGRSVVTLAPVFNPLRTCHAPESGLEDGHKVLSEKDFSVRVSISDKGRTLPGTRVRPTRSADRLHDTDNTDR